MGIIQLVFLLFFISIYLVIVGGLAYRIFGRGLGHFAKPKYELVGEK